MPPPQDSLQLPHPPHDPAQFPAQAPALQLCVCGESDGHAVPPPLAAVVTAYVRCWVPPPQDSLQLPHPPHDPAQFTTGGAGGGGGGEPTLMVKTWATVTVPYPPAYPALRVTVPELGIISVVEVLVVRALPQPRVPLENVPALVSSTTCPEPENETDSELLADTVPPLATADPPARPGTGNHAAVLPPTFTWMSAVGRRGGGGECRALRHRS